MDEKDKQRIRNDNARIFEPADRFKVNKIRHDIKSSLIHKNHVEWFCTEHMYKGHHILTRAHIAKNTRKGRLCADAVCLDCGIIHEVAVSEKEKSLERKKQIWEALGFEYETKRVY